MNLEAVKAASKQLRAARKAVDRAIQARNRAFKTAHANGYTWRAIASAAGITEDKEHFLEAAGLLDYGDKYLDGYQAAKKLGIPMDKETS